MSIFVMVLTQDYEICDQLAPPFIHSNFCMLYLSKFPFKTTKNLPSGADNRGTQLLLQA